MKVDFTSRDREMLYGIAKALYGGSTIPTKRLGPASTPWPVTAAGGTLNGPLPVSFGFNTILGPSGLVAIFLSGTVFDGVGGRLVTLSYKVDTLAAVNFSMFINPANVHTTFPTKFFTLTGLAIGLHTLVIAHVTNGTSDASDRWSLMGMEMAQ